jgi:hypothetical protein
MVEENCDDLENNGGAEYVRGVNAKCADGDGDDGFSDIDEFQHLLNEVTVTPCGKKHFYICDLAHSESSAIRYAIMEATGPYGGIEKCVFAAGSFVCDGFSDLRLCCSAREGNISSPYYGVKHPADMDEGAVDKIIPLPYLIPGEFTISEQKEYEKRCLTSLVATLYRSTIFGKPIKALFMELILSGNGAMLSKEALQYIGRICFTFGVNIIVDERMTAGRSGNSMLFLFDMNAEFRFCVTHVILGGWLKVAVCLCSPAFFDKTQQRMQGKASVERPGYAVPLGDALKILKVVWQCIAGGAIPKRRQKVLETLALAPGEVWGAGLLLFTSKPSQRNHAQAIRIRCLPLLSDDTIIRNADPEEICRASINKDITESVLRWVLTPSGDVDLALFFLLVKRYSKKLGPYEHFDRRDTLTDMLLTGKDGSMFTKVMIYEAIARAVKSGYLQNCQKLASRERVVVLRKVLSYKQFPPVTQRRKKENTGGQQSTMQAACGNINMRAVSGQQTTLQQVHDGKCLRTNKTRRLAKSSTSYDKPRITKFPRRLPTRQSQGPVRRSPRLHSP